MLRHFKKKICLILAKGTNCTAQSWGKLAPKNTWPLWQCVHCLQHAAHTGSPVTANAYNQSWNQSSIHLQVHKGFPSKVVLKPQGRTSAPITTWIIFLSP